MKYLQITLPLPQEEWIADLLRQQMADIGFDSFREEEAELLAFIPKESYDEQALLDLLSTAPFDTLALTHSTSELEDLNWNEEWEKHYFQPVIVVENELAIRASFHPAVAGVKHEIIIDPKMAFGTGNHATTQAMLTLLSQIHLEGASVIDMGCGSGILGIYAMKKGARQCTSIDIDEWSVANAKENAKNNDVTLTVLQGDATALDQVPRADIFLANINRNIILQDLDRYVNRMHPSGIMLLSGFLISDLPVIMDAVTAHGLTLSGHIEMPGDWLAVRVTNQMP